MSSIDARTGGLTPSLELLGVIPSIVSTGDEVELLKLTVDDGVWVKL